jgi:(2S)-methylsuccinyl-CoA dehydrogenase
VRADVQSAGLDACQHQAHGLAWLATYVEALRQMTGWAARLEADGRLGELEALLLTAAVGEYAGQIAGGLRRADRRAACGRLACG